MSEVSASVQRYLDAFENDGPGLPGAEHRWISELRERSLVRFRDLGFPSSRSSTPLASSAMSSS